VTLPVPGKLQCPWIHPALARLVIARDAYERAGRPRAAVTAGDIEQEIAAVAVLRAKLGER